MEHTTTSTHSIFEKYQTFFALVICGLLIGGGIIIAKVIESKTSSGAVGSGETQESVRSDMLSIAKDLGINKNQFATCLDNETNKQKIADAVTLAQNSGVQGTPTFFILQGSKQFMILGARDQATFEKAIAEGRPPEGQPAQPQGQKIVLTDSDHWIGPKDAKTIIVEYADIDCYYCKQAHPTINKLLKDHPDYALVYRHSPIASLHPWAEYKAQASECAAQLGKGDETFFKFLDNTIQ